MAFLGLRLTSRISLLRNPKVLHIGQVGAFRLSTPDMNQNPEDGSSCSSSSSGASNRKNNWYQLGRSAKCNVPDSEWKKQLTEEQYQVCREKGTEMPFSGEYNFATEPGFYHCACCGATLFRSEAKFDSSCGWPSFHTPFKFTGEKGEMATNIKEEKDTSHGMTRTEVMCKQCDAHLGHVFPDEPPPSQLRYCINSASLQFEATNK